MKNALLTLALAGMVGTASAAPQPEVVFHTNRGDIRIALYAERAPVTVENFLAYVDAGFYDGTIFHRVIPGFVIQGGGFTEDMQRKSTREPIENEADNGLDNERGTLSMARTQAVDSATSQFFINLADNAFLDHGERDFGYAVFARVVDGMDVVDEMAGVPTGRASGMSDVPRQTLVIESAERVDG
ncbi:Peptidyl-prolyl cis-trans isomerase A [wastewater metagenome]|uniref:peptidylprolyl isomerase n=4 Tax=root TaxID=1 RepID=A0A5B8RJQ1_9ZZZZ|nr:peptidyl-prolyl cis-trans isomerase A [uncultured organism]